MSSIMFSSNICVPKVYALLDSYIIKDTNFKFCVMLITATQRQSCIILACYYKY